MDSERQIRDYLLGSLPAERREEVEQRIFDDDNFHQEIEIAEEELLDDYIRGKLPEPDRRLFETNFLASPLRRRRLQFARALYSKANANPGRVPVPRPYPLARFYPYALAAAAILAAFMGVVNYQYAKKIKEDQARLALLTWQVENAFPAGKVGPNSILQADLVPKGSRSGPQSQLVFPEGILAVRFNLAVPLNVEGVIKLDLLNDAGQIIISQQGIQIERGERGNLATVTIETKYLRPGDYFLRVAPQRGKPILEYPFQVLRASTSVSDGD